MIVLGLTGSIGMGKSTTATMFEDEGCAVFDADASVHTLYAKGGPVVPIIRAVFPDAVVDGAVDRSVLSQHILDDPLQITVLESFVHPLIGERRERALNEARSAGKAVFVDDNPLLFEMKREADVDKIVVVTAAPNVQKRRVLSRPGMSEEKFQFILGRQMPDAEKRERADFLIYTDQGLDSARTQVKQVISDLHGTLDL